MKSIKLSDLRDMEQNGTSFKLYDLREDYEYSDYNIGASRLLMSEVMDRYEEIPRDIPVIFHCESGNRSRAVVESLERLHQFSNLYSLEGGIQAIRETEQS